jgi:hypothetical protein
LVIGTIDEFDFGQRFLEGDGPERKRHAITSLNRYALSQPAVFPKPRYYKESGEKNNWKG